MVCKERSIPLPRVFINQILLFSFIKTKEPCDNVRSLYLSVPVHIFSHKEICIKECYAEALTEYIVTNTHCILITTCT